MRHKGSSLEFALGLEEGETKVEAFGLGLGLSEGKTPNLLLRLAS